MSYIKYSDASRADLVRLYAFLEYYDQNTAQRAIDTIIRGIDNIGKHPLSGVLLPECDNIRRFVIDFGATGYLVFHKRYEEKNINFIARIIHQKEWYDTASIGLEEEKKDKVWG